MATYFILFLKFCLEIYQSQIIFETKIYLINQHKDQYKVQDITKLIFMWYFKQTAKSLWNASKGMVTDNRTKVQKILDEISLSEQQIISTTKLNQLAALTFEIEQFEQTLDSILKKIKTFQYDLDEARKTLNIMIATNYLLKHGATAFVDELRGYIHVFQKYQSLKDARTYEDEVLQKQMSYELQKIKSRARHIQVLLSDKQKLLKEKQLSMLIRQKMKLYEKSQTGDSKQSYNNDNRNERLQKQRIKVAKNQKPGNNSNEPKKGNKIDNYADKLQGYMEKYLWKYVDKLDEKFEVISDKILDNYDKYILGQLPANFEPYGLEDETEGTDGPSSDKKMKRQEQSPVQYQSLDDDDQLMKKLQEEGNQNVEANLIDFEQVNEDDINGKHTKQQYESLI